MENLLGLLILPRGGGGNAEGCRRGGGGSAAMCRGGEGGTAEGGDFRSLRTWASRGALTASSTSSMACKPIARMPFFAVQRKTASYPWLQTHLQSGWSRYSAQ